MSPIIANSSPKEDRISFCNQYLKPGAVLRFHIPLSRPPKTKRVVVAAIDENINSVGLLFINSDINPNVFLTAKLRKLHLFLTAAERNYLDSDSYLDCSDLHEWQFARLKTKFIAKPQIYLGRLSETDMTKVRQTIITAKTITKKLKKRYGFIG